MRRLAPRSWARGSDVGTGSPPSPRGATGLRPPGYSCRDVHVAGLGPRFTGRGSVLPRTVLASDRRRWREVPRPPRWLQIQRSPPPLVIEDSPPHLGLIVKETNEDRPRGEAHGAVCGRALTRSLCALSPCRRGHRRVAAAQGRRLQSSHGVSSHGRG